ncbi:MAG: DUF4359 domain-containing protein [Microcoleaceae cyanobacterium]
MVDVSNSDNMKPEKSPSKLGGCLGKAAIVLAILAGTMVFTNPSRQDYLNYASSKLAKEVKQNICKESQVPQILSELSESLVNLCSSVVTNQRDAIEGYLDRYTQRQNAYLLSLYSTDVLDKRYRTVGAFGHFLTFSAEELKSSDASSQS